MSGETAVSNNSTEEVGKEVKAEVKIMEAEKASPPKVSGESLKPEESSCPAASSAEPESKIDLEKKIEPPVKEEVKEIDGDEKLKAEDSPVVAAPLVEISEQKIEDEQVELPPIKEEKQIENDSIVGAADKDIPVVEKVSVPEPDVCCASEPISEKIESKSEDKLDTKIDEKLEQSKVEAIEEKQAEPQKEVALPAESSIKAVEEVVEYAEELPPKEVEAILAKEATVSEAACKHSESVGGNPVEPAKIVDVAGQSPVQPFYRKVESVEEIPAKGVEIIEEKEAKVSEAEIKPEENSETEPTKKLVGSKAEFIEEKQDEPEKIVELPEKSSVPAVEERVKSVEEFPITNVKGNEEKEVNDSETECKVDKNSEIGPAAKQEVSTAKLIEEKLDEPTKIAHVPEQSSIEVVDKKVEKLPAKIAEATTEKEVKVSETECKPEETIETKHVKLIEEKPVESTNIIEVPEKSLAKAVEEKLEKVEEFPAEVLETIEEKLVKISEAECKHEETFETKPIELVREKSVESAKIDDVLEKKSIEAIEERLEKVEELPAKEVEEIQERALKVLEAECKPEEIPETEPVEKLEESKLELVEEKPEKPSQILDVPEQSSVETVEDNMGKGVELPVKEVEAILEKEMKVSDAECKPEEIPETELVAKLKESKVALVEEKIDNPTQIADVREQSSVEVVEDNTGNGIELVVQEIEAILEKEVKVSDAECKPEEIQETEPREKLKESKVELVEEKSEKPTLVDVPEQSPAEAIENNKGKGVEFSDKEVEPILQDEMKVSEAECKPEEETELSEKQEESKVKLVEEKLDEPKQATNLAEQISIKDVEDKVEKRVELPVKEVEATGEKEEKLPEVECKPEEISEIKPAESVEEETVKPPKIVNAPKQSSVYVAEEELEKVEELLAKVAEPSLEKEAKILEIECKPDVISESVRLLEEEPVEQYKATEPTRKETLAAEPVENVRVEDEQSKVTEPTKKETLAAEPAENVMVEDTKSLKEEEPIKPKTQVEQTDLVCSTTDEISEKNDATNEENEFVKKTVVIDALPELVESGKIEVETEAPEEKSVKVESPQCETNPIEDDASSIHLTEKSVEKEIATKDIDLVAENGNTKHETVASTETTKEEVEGNGDEEATKESEKTEPEKKIEDIAHSLKEKLEQEKHDDEAIKTDVQNAESTKECEDTKTSEHVPKEDAVVKTTQKQSNNIIKMVKHSLGKAKKAIIGKSSNSKAQVSESKGDDACK